PGLGWMPNKAISEIRTVVSYLPTGEPSAIIREDALGVPIYVRTLQYDSLGRLVENREPASGAWRYAYNDDGQLVGTSDARGCGKNLLYDAAARVVAEDFSPCLD